MNGEVYMRVARGSFVVAIQLCAVMIHIVLFFHTNQAPYTIADRFRVCQTWNGPCSPHTDIIATSHKLHTAAAKCKTCQIPKRTCGLLCNPQTHTPSSSFPPTLLLVLRLKVAKPVPSDAIAPLEDGLPLKATQ